MKIPSNALDREMFYREITEACLVSRNDRIANYAPRFDLMVLAVAANVLVISAPLPIAINASSTGLRTVVTLLNKNRGARRSFLPMISEVFKRSIFAE